MSLSCRGFGVAELLFVAFAVGAVVHEEVDFFGAFRADDLIEALAGVLEVGASRDVDEDECLAFEDGEPFGDVVDVEVGADFGAFFVVGFEEGALGDDDLGAADVFADEVWSWGGVAEVGDEGDLEGSGDLDAAVFELAEFFLWEVGVLGLEFGAFLHDGVAHGGACVFGVEATEEDVVFDLELLVVFEGDDVEGGFLSFEVDEALHHAADVRGDACVADDGGVAHALEASLGAVVREGADVVHVSV